MASCATSITSAFSSLSFASPFSSGSPIFLPFRAKTLTATGRRASFPLRCNVASSADFEASPDIEDSPDLEESLDLEESSNLEDSPDLESVPWQDTTLEKYIKSRLPGGIAAQEFLATGKRKTAIARVALQEGTGRIFINYRLAEDYLQGNPFWVQFCRAPLEFLGYEKSYDVFVKVHGGGLSGQAQAISLGVARALLKISEENGAPLRSVGLLTRDPRIVERKKVGLHKARKAHQYSKR